MLYGYICMSCSYVQESERPEASTKCLPLSFPTLAFETGSLIGPSAYRFHLDFLD